MTRHAALSLTWLLGTVIGAGALIYVMTAGEDRSLFLPGETSWGHHQIELQCGTCHGDSFTDPVTLQNACVDCHSEELEAAHDSHPRSKFTDPRNANRLEMVDARQCVSCHAEHRPEMTHPMGVTLPDDYCVWCHKDIADERPSHTGMEFDTCASAGCHNYHDNRALYEDFLLKAGSGDGAPDIVMARVPGKNLAEYLRWSQQLPSLPAPDDHAEDPYTHTVHDQAGVQCMSCHGEGEDWQARPAVSQCASCHEREEKGFLAGKHGMRLAAGLSAMSPALARLPMHDASLDEELDCVSCHGGHQFDVVEAATESCLTCHADDHSQAFMDSPHGQLWEQARNSEIELEQGVSCATCHMPRINHGSDGSPRIHVQHNQNDTLRPNEKMIRPVCLNCHELQFSLDALADEALIRNNFSGHPQTDIPSIEMAKERSRTREEKKSVY